MGELTERLVAQQREVLESLKDAGESSKLAASSIHGLAQICEALIGRVQDLEDRVAALEER